MTQSDFLPLLVIKYVITTYCGFLESDTVAYNSVVFVT